MASDYCTGSMITPNFDCGSSARRTPDLLIKNEPNKIKEISITQMDYGYILRVGCKTIALDTPAKILFGLKLYLANPNKVEQAFLRGEFKFEK